MKRMTLVEKAMLERLREKQVTQQLTHPEMGSMVAIQKQIEDVLTSSSISDAEKVNLLDRARVRFVKMKENLHPARTLPPAIDVVPTPPVAAPPAVLGSAPPAVDGSAPPVAVGATPVATRLDTGVGPSPQPIYDTVQLPQQYEAKFANLKAILDKNPNLITKNANNEMIVQGKVIPGSNFDHLMRNMYVRSQSYNLTGLTDLMSALRRVNVPTNFLSNKDAIAILKPTYTYKSTPSRPVKTPFHVPHKRRKQVSPASPTQVRSSQKVESGEDTFHSPQEGKGHPPGKRPRVLFLYR